MSQARSTSSHTLGAALERDRLERRVSRIAVAVAALRQRASEHRREPGTAPQPIGQAIADFEAQIAALNARLWDLGHDWGSTPVREWSGSDDDGN